MMRSLYSGVAGLKTHQTKMDVIGNNISNVNTVAFKSSTTTFQDLMYQTTQAASGATENKGGTNAKQIGLGVTNGATKVTITGAGAAQSTGDAFDIRLTDSKSTNFFIVNNGAENQYTRAGSFYIDGVGNLAMTTTGYLVMGWQVSPETGAIQKTDTVSALRVMQKENMESAPEFTSAATFSGVLDKNDTDVTSSVGYSRSLTFYDNLGYAYTAKFSFKAKDTDKGTYTVQLDSIIDGAGKDIYADYLAEDANRKPSEVFGMYNPETDKNGLKKGVEFATYPTANGDKTWLTITKEGKTYVVENMAAAAVTSTFPDANGTNNQVGLTGFKLKELGEPTIVDGKKIYTYPDASAPELEFKVNELYDISTSEMLNGSADAANPNYYVPLDSATVTLTDPVVKGENDALDKYYFSSDFKTLMRSTDNYSFDVQFDTRTGKFSYVEKEGSDTATLAINKFPKDGMGQAFSDITIDFTNLLNYDNGGSSTVQLERGGLDGTTGAGKKLGHMTGVSVDTSGKIWGSYDNGNTVLLGQIAVAQFSNASGMEEVGSNCYKSTLNSGDPNIVEVSADGGSMNTGQLEMSNVDLSAEFTDMIVTQRGFQANSRIITVSDTLLEELINLKR